MHTCARAWQPTYCSEACVYNGFTATPRAAGTVEYATEISSYETLVWDSVTVVTVQMGQYVSTIAGCDYGSQVAPTDSSPHSSQCPVPTDV